MENNKEIKFYIARALDFTKGEGLFEGELDEFSINDKTKEVMIYERDGAFYDYLNEKPVYVGASRIETKQEDFYCGEGSLFVLKDTMQEISKEAIATRLLFQTKSRINTEKMFNELKELQAATETFRENFKNEMIDYVEEVSEEMKRR